MPPKLRNCTVCGQMAHGLHFGAITCRACAVFFKRANSSRKRRRLCQLTRTCVIFDGVKYPCKACRLQKCKSVGMKPDNIQVQLPEPTTSTTISKSLEQFVGRPSLVIFTNDSKKCRTFMDVREIVSKASNFLKTGVPLVLTCGSQLEKLSLVIGTEYKTKRVSHVSKDFFSFIVEKEFMTSANWLMHFDDFRNLPNGIQMQLLQSVWHVWGRLYKIAKSRNLREKADDNAFPVGEENHIDLEQVQFDMSWLTSYPWEQISYFLDQEDGKWPLENFVEKLIQLNLSNVELAFMLAHLSFEYAGNRYGGETREITDRLIEVLSDNLHDYYVSNNTRTSTVYSARLAQILKVNREILYLIRKVRDKTKIAYTFDIFTADFSHPEMFMDTGFGPILE